METWYWFLPVAISVALLVSGIWERIEKRRRDKKEKRAMIERLGKEEQG